jgi:predicted RNase H-like HicB family nuclease
MSDVIRIEFTLPYELLVEGKWHIAACKPLDVASQGHTSEEAIRNLEEALGLFLESCLERGTLPQVLGDDGSHSINSKRPAGVSPGLTITVPVVLSAA